MATLKKKIWIVLDSRGFGGIESHVEQLALGLSSARTDVTVVFLNQYGEHPIQKRLLYHGLDCQILDGRIVSLWQAIRKDMPDVIHTHGYKAGILARPIAKMMGITCASTFHSGEVKEGKMKFYDWVDRHTAFLANQVYAVSTPVLESIPCPAKLANNFVNVEDSEASNGDQIAFVGRLSKEKAPERFVHLAKRFPHLEFHVYGDGPMLKSLEKSAPQNLTFHGAQSDMRKVWNLIGLLVIPSRAEGLPMSSLEAMARGIPVAAFNVGALGQLIEHNHNGWLLEQGDMNGLVEVIHQWRNSDVVQRAEWRMRAISTIKKDYSAEAVVPQLLKAYATAAK
ncbi:glycosyltransferase family 4 protein [Enterovibrio sp. ZSDZ42]|uniref:Glycosyltransferase family 4 protein n=1 Tax=Enterovibrio gelatinilyticus TaxID=2899819 RepID=A0ABT5R321_9GAMM|nr:glycosyltransferase family 4 protein [Enterovibrio sp. ZSDZ42]MDD1794671.1 glycosyltransferase family 4 protein [Enterovibrio sp. ZSDZ42]